MRSAISSLVGDQEAGGMCETVACVLRELAPEERGHQREGLKLRQREQPHADVGLQTRDVTVAIRHREFRVQVDEEIEPDFMRPGPLQGVEVLVDIAELFGLDVQAALFVELPSQAEGEALPEFEMATWERVALAAGFVVRLLSKDGIVMDQDPASPYEEFAAGLMQPEHRVPPPCRVGAG